MWFDSIESAAQVLGTRIPELLKMIDLKKPKSMRELSAMSGRQESNLSRTLKKMTFYGVVEFKRCGRNKVPIAKATAFNS